MQAAEGDRPRGHRDAGGGAARTEGGEGAGAPPYRMVFPEGRNAATTPRPGGRGAAGGRSGKPKVETIHPDAAYL